MRESISFSLFRVWSSEIPLKNFGMWSCLARERDGLKWGFICFWRFMFAVKVWIGGGPGREGTKSGRRPGRGDGCAGVW